MVIGEFETKITEKRRTAIPKKFRDEIGTGLIITRGYEKSLVIVNQEMWNRIAAPIINGSFINRNIRETSRLIVGGAYEIELDSVGRFVIPSNLAEYAELEEEIMIVGLVNWIEIWKKNNWIKKMENLQEKGDEIAQELINANRTETGKLDARK